MRRLFLLLPLLAMLSGCGYALVGHTNLLPPGMKTIQVPTFKNRTTRVELEQRVTQAVASEMVARGRLTLVSGDKDADLILKGSIDSFALTPVAFNADGRATQYQVAVTANIQLLNHKEGDTVIWKNDQYRFTDSYPVSITSTDSFDQETRAIIDIAQIFAQSLVTNLLEGF